MVFTAVRSKAVGGPLLIHCLFFSLFVVVPIVCGD